MAASVAFWALLAFLSHGVNRPPVIDKVQIEPSAIPLGTSAAVRFYAADPDRGRLTYECSADAGSCVVADKNKPEATYSPSERAAVGDRITLSVTVTDPSGLTSTGSQIATVVPPLPAAPPPAAAPVGTNRPPVLSGGGSLHPEGDTPIVLEATGSDPDGDEVTFKWDFDSCLLSANAEPARAEVRLGPGCESGKAVLTGTDTHGASATAEWEIHR